MGDIDSVKRSSPSQPSSALQRAPQIDSHARTRNGSTRCRRRAHHEDTVASTLSASTSKSRAQQQCRERQKIEPERPTNGCCKITYDQRGDAGKSNALVSIDSGARSAQDQLRKTGDFFEGVIRTFARAAHISDLPDDAENPTLR